MDEYQPTRSLMIAIFAQAVKDVQSRTKQRRREAWGFLKSPGFAWLWEGITDDITGVPPTNKVQDLALRGQIDMSSAKHKRLTKGGKTPCYA